MYLLLLLLLLPAVQVSVQGFSPSQPKLTRTLNFRRATPPLSHSHHDQHQLRSQLSATSNSADGRDDWDVESARRHLEDLMGGGGAGGDTPDSTFAVADKLPLRVSSPPQLTAIARVRRTAEIQLLSQLEDNLDAADALNDLWVHERGNKAAKDLQKADELFQQGESSWNKAADLFRQLISEHGPYWVEPLHRLSLLHYLQGRHHEARQLEDLVLSLKPWHMGSLSNKVRIAESQHDVETALQWAAKRLPPRVGLRRSEWVERSVQSAMNLLSRDEQRLTDFLGTATFSPADDGAWQ
jgi:hypothetical protein